MFSLKDKQENILITVEFYFTLRFNPLYIVKVHNCVLLKIIQGNARKKAKNFKYLKI